ncbi:hypothetical protein ABZ128_10705 [Streptomyces sp. NPDC006326]|uniref:hypothetical protein n=1 Tax=Streptomyces sp. NPDC006326 TaxID=3156752 RepID=UPI0033B26140
MKLRHVRAVAVFGIAVVALTGARGSHGAGCGGGSHGSSHSNSSGSSTGGSHDNDNTNGGSGGVSAPGGSRSNDKAERDIKIDKCRLNDAGKNLVARLTVTNSGSLDYTYNITVKFRPDAGSGTNTAMANVTGLTVKAGASQQAEATSTYSGKGDGSEYKECVIVSATKSAL